MKKQTHLHSDDMRVRKCLADFHFRENYDTIYEVANSYDLTLQNSYDFCKIVRVLRVANSYEFVTNDLHLTLPLNLPVSGV